MIWPDFFRHSLRGQLSRLLLLVVTPLWLLAMVLLLLISRHEVYELYDEQQQLFAEQLYAALPSLRGDVEDDDALPAFKQALGKHMLVGMWHADGHRLLGDEEGKTLLPKPQQTGYASIDFHGQQWRVYYLQGEQGSVAIAQQYAERWEVIRGLVLTHAVMWLLLLPLALLAVWWAVGRGLSPLTALQQTLLGKTPDDNTALPEPQQRELKPLVAALNRWQARLQQVLQQERRFTADAAHELRSPLAAIRVQAEVVQLVDDPAAREHALQQLLTGVDRASKLIQQLLTLSRLDSLQAQSLQPVDWPSLLADLQGSLAAEAANAGAELHFPPAGACWPVNQGEPVLLQLMLRNLLENALRYGGKRIELACDEQGIHVLDDGPGLAADELARVRERFYRPAGQQVQGSGLGLSIVERIAELHGLQLQLANRPDDGLQVSLQLVRSERTRR